MVKKRILTLLAALALAAGIVGVQPAPPAQAATVSATCAWVNLSCIPSVVITESWSDMWTIHNREPYVGPVAAATCYFAPGASKAACGIIVGLEYAYTVSHINSGIANKQCTRIRYPIPPYTSSGYIVAVYRVWNGPCLR